MEALVFLYLDAFLLKDKLTNNITLEYSFVFFLVNQKSEGYYMSMSDCSTSLLLYASVLSFGTSLICLSEKMNPLSISKFINDCIKSTHKCTDAFKTHK